MYFKSQSKNFEEKKVSNNKNIFYLIVERKTEISSNKRVEPPRFLTQCQ